MELTEVVVAVVADFRCKSPSRGSILLSLQVQIRHDDAVKYSVNDTLRAIYRASWLFST